MLRIALLVGLLLLASCHHGEHCVKSHTECVCIPAVCSFVGQVAIPEAQDTCDAWEANRGT